MAWKKEIIDQPLHALWSGGSVLTLFLAWRVPMPLWASVLLTGASLGSLAGICVREWAQKRHKPGGIWHNWPWLDTAGYAAGAVVGALLADFL